MAKRLFRIAILMILLPLLTAGALFSLVCFREEPGTSEYGLYTFERELALPNGKNVSFFESGDPYYHYYHDKEGFLLLKEEGELFYAVNDNGRPVSSGVRYTAPQLMINNVDKMTGGEVDLNNNPDLLTDYPVLEECEPQPIYYAGGTGTA